MVSDYIKVISYSKFYSNNEMGTVIEIETTSGNKAEGRSVGWDEEFQFEKIENIFLDFNVIDHAKIDELLSRIVAKGIVPRQVATAASIAVTKLCSIATGIPIYQFLGGILATKLSLPTCICVAGSNRYLPIYEKNNNPRYFFISYNFNSFKEASYSLWEVIRDFEKKSFSKFNYGYEHGTGMYFFNGSINNDKQLWELMAETIISTGYLNKIGIGVDVGASSFYDKEKDIYNGIFDDLIKTKEQLIEYYLDMENYPFIYLEDPFYQDDFSGFKALRDRGKFFICGNKLVNSNKNRLIRAIKEESVDGITIEINKFKTVTEMLQFTRLIKEYGKQIIIEGDVEEDVDFIDFCVGTGCIFAKNYGLSIYGNRYLEIEEKIKTDSVLNNSCFINKNREVNYEDLE